MNRALAILGLWVFGSLGVCSAARHPGGPRDGANLREAVTYEFAVPVSFAIVGTNSFDIKAGSVVMSNSTVATTLGTWTSAGGGDPNTNILTSSRAGLITLERPFRVGRTIIRGNLCAYEVRSVDTGIDPRLDYYPGGASPLTQSNMVLAGLIIISNMPSPVFGNFDLGGIGAQPGSPFGVNQINMNGNPNTTGAKFRTHTSGTTGTGINATNNVAYWYSMSYDASATAPSGGVLRLKWWHFASKLLLGESISTGTGLNSIYNLTPIVNGDHDLIPAGLVVVFAMQVGKFGDTNHIAPWPL